MSPLLGKAKLLGKKQKLNKNAANKFATRAPLYNQLMENRLQNQVSEFSSLAFVQENSDPKSIAKLESRDLAKERSVDNQNQSKRRAKKVEGKPDDQKAVLLQPHGMLATG